MKTKAQQAPKKVTDSTSLPGTTSGYHYDPERASKRRVVAYTEEEFEMLTKEEQRRVLRNRETAAASKARKRQKLQDLQEEAAELAESKRKLEDKIQRLTEKLQEARTTTAKKLSACQCKPCKQLEEQVAQYAAATDVVSL